MDGLEEFQGWIVIGNIDSGEPCQHRLPVDCSLAMERFEARSCGGVIERMSGGETGARVFVLGGQRGAGQKKSGCEQQAGYLAGHAGTIPRLPERSGKDSREMVELSRIERSEERRVGKE